MIFKLKIRILSYAIMPDTAFGKVLNECFNTSLQTKNIFNSFNIEEIVLVLETTFALCEVKFHFDHVTL